jgi:hypothetical protein
MPSFKFRGFTGASLVALTVAQGAQSVSASTTWGPAQTTPNASFTIQLVDGCTDVVAPYGAVLRATGFTGFSVSEPAGDTNVYDPTQHKITCIWDFDDPGYQPATTPNIPTVWRNPNLAYGKQVAHVWNTPGSYTVTCFAFDAQGNWGTATYTFAQGGNSPAIADPSLFFSTNKTICVSQAGDFADAPVASTKVTTIAAARAAMQSLWGTGQRTMRLLIRAGETFTNTGLAGDLASGSNPGNPRDNLKGLHIGIFGSGPRPVFRRTQPGTPDFISFPDRADCRQLVVADMDFRGDWSAATETGNDLGAGSALYTAGFNLFHRCRFDGFSSTPADHDMPRPIVFSDTEITNWGNYGTYCDSRFFVFLGCDLHQHSDALNGVGQETGGQQPTELGNRHGPFRNGSRGYDSIFSGSSFFSRNGWFPASGGTTFQQSFEQACIRFMQHFSSDGTNVRRHHHVWDRCSFEGGDSVAAVGPSVPPNNFIETNGKNMVIDKCLFVGTAATYGSLLSISLSGVTIRNSYFYRHNVGITYSNQPGSEIAVGFSSNGTLSGVGPVEIYNNTILIATPGAALSSSYLPVNAQAGHTYTIENNVVRVINRPAHAGAEFLPLGDAPVSGFACRYKGARWNFRPIVIGVGAARANEAGTAGNVAPGQWVSIPYPNQTGQCAGAGQQLSQALVTGNATQRHQVSMTWRPNNAEGGNEGEFRRMTDAALFPGSKGGVTFDFTATAIRMRNDTSRSWPADRDLWVLLDQSDRLMGFLAGSGQDGLPVPLAAPAAGSAAIVPGGQGLWARDDFFGALRNGQTVMGAFQPAV